jgi:nitrate reductase NapE
MSEVRAVPQTSTGSDVVPEHWRTGSATGNLTKRDEWRSFVFLTVVMVPVLAVIIVAGYGFAVWMTQLISGPPTGG